jgi:hypothetical protein
MFSDDPPVRRHSGASWQEPFHWWGPQWQAPVARSLNELVELGMVTEAQARWLVDHLHSGKSMLVASLPQGAGKSTLAHALSGELPDRRLRVYLRGMYEPFDWLSESSPSSTTILVNEISPHLPIYAWGETLRHLLVLSEAGYQVVGTIHADSVEEVVAQLAPYPIQATAAQIAALSVVVFITVAVDGDNMTRHVSSIVSLAVDSASGGLIAIPVTG